MPTYAVRDVEPNSPRLQFDKQAFFEEYRSRFDEMPYDGHYDSLVACIDAGLKAGLIAAYGAQGLPFSSVRLVEAGRPETALKHVVASRYNVTLATAADGVDAGKAGRSIEVAGAEPDVPATPIEQAAAANTGNVLDEVVPVPTETWPAHQAKEEGV